MDKCYYESDVREMLKDAYQNGFNGPLDLMDETVDTILEDYQDSVVHISNNKKSKPDYLLRSSE